MSRPRLGDSLVSKEMKPFVIVEVDLETVRAEPEQGSGKVRAFAIRRLEEVDTGLWQETEA